MSEKEFINQIVLRIEKDELKNFPFDFIDESLLKRIDLPQKTLVLGKEFFGNVEILTTQGESVMQSEDYDTAKFIVYSSRNRNGIGFIPADKVHLKTTLKSYEQHLDSILNLINTEYRKILPGTKNQNFISNEVFRILNLTRL